MSTTDATQTSSRRALVPRLPLIVFIAMCVVAFVVLVNATRRLWYFGDEWTFIISRQNDLADGKYLDFLLQPHNEHWSTLPVLLYTAIFKLFGLHTYVPYVAATIVAHIAVVALIRVLLRRLGISPWHATIAAGTLLLLGTGGENLTWAFQVGMISGVALGLTQLILADHEGPLTWRDVIGVGVGLLALATAGTALPLIAGVGATMLIKRRWRAAALHTLVPGVVYYVWYRAYAADVPGKPDANAVPYYTYYGVTHSLEALTQWHSFGPGVLALIVAAAALVGRDTLARTASAWGCAAAAVAFFMFSGLRRAGFGVDQSASSRYMYVGAVLLLPCLVVVLEHFAPKLRGPGILLAGLAGWAVLGNAAALRQFVEDRHELIDRTRGTILAAAAIAGEPGIVPTDQAEPEFQPIITMADLAKLVEDDRLPVPDIAAADLLAARARLLVHTRDSTADDEDTTDGMITGVEHAVVNGIGTNCISVHPENGRPRLDMSIDDSASFTITPLVDGEVTVTLQDAGDSGVTASRGIPVIANQSFAVTAATPLAKVLELPADGDTIVCGLAFSPGG